MGAVSNDIQSSVIGAVENIASTYVSRLEIDKTVQATIVQCENADIGAHLVKYNGGVMRAYSQDPSVTYAANTLVYVLVPKGDFSERKFIIGKVDASDDSSGGYVWSVLDNYNPVGGNPITSSEGSFGLHSYLYEQDDNDDIIMLYTEGSENNRISIDEVALSEYMMRSSAFELAFNVTKNELSLHDDNLKAAGNYGMVCVMKFTDASNADNTVFRTYVLDINSMVGNPFKYIGRQSRVVTTADMENFAGIYQIYLFCDGFSTENESAANKERVTIKINNISIQALKEDKVNDEGYKINLKFPLGAFFSTDDAATKKISVEANLLRNKVKLDAVTWTLGRADASVSYKNEDSEVNPILGEGWAEVSGGNTESGTYKNNNIRKKDNTAYENIYKLVAVHGDDDKVVASSEFYVINDGERRDITIMSSRGTKFSFDAGSTILTVTVKERGAGGSITEGSNCSKYSYKWYIAEGSGTKKEIADNVDTGSYAQALQKAKDDVQAAYSAYMENEKDTSISEEERERRRQERRQAYEDAMSAYSAARDDFEDARNISTSHAWFLGKKDGEWTYVIDDDDTCGKAHRYLEYFVGSIEEGTVTVQCVVLDSVGHVRGDVEIVLVKDDSGGIQSDYSIVIDNGTQAFLYDEAGISPTNEKNGQDALTILPLTARLYGPGGSYIRDAMVRWEMPLESDTLLRRDKKTENLWVVDEDNRKMTYSFEECDFDIQDLYTYKKTKNQITCVMTFNDTEYRQTTDFVFLKEGDNGTKGSDVSCRIGFVSDNSEYGSLESDDSHIHYVAIRNDDDVKTVRWHWKTKNGLLLETPLTDVRLKAIVYKNGKRLEDSEISAVEWSINNCKYFTIDSGKDYLTYSPDRTIGRESELYIRAKITVKGDGVYYAYYPFPVIEYVDNVTMGKYSAEFTPSGTMRYVTYNSDGKQPKYAPNTGVLLDTPNMISKASGKTVSWKVAWSYCGGVDENEETADISISDEVSEGVVEVDSIIDKPIYPSVTVIPNSSYSGLYSNAVKCAISVLQSSSTTGNYKLIANAIIPIHMQLNRYELMSLNDWDGRSIKINDTDDDTDEYILAPQIGAGKKNNENGFTGIVMGTRVVFDDKQKGKATQNTKEDVGLFGYNNGKQSIFFDASDGSAHFGTPDTDDMSNVGMIEFYPYTVDSNGRQVPSKTSHIGHWYIGHNSLYNISETVDNNSYHTVTDASKIPPYRSIVGGNRKYSGLSKYNVANAQIGMGPNQQGMILNSNPSYLSVKSRPLGLTNTGEISTDSRADGIVWTDSMMTKGDSLEVEINPLSASVFTIYRHRFVVTKGNEEVTSEENLKYFFPSALSSDTWPMTHGADDNKLSGQWERRPVAGIDRDGSFYSNAVKSGNLSLNIGTIEAFGVSAKDGKYIGAKIFDDNNRNLMKAFIKPHETDADESAGSETLYITTGTSLRNENARKISVISKEFNSYVSSSGITTIPNKYFGMNNNGFSISYDDSSTFSFGKNMSAVNTGSISLSSNSMSAIATNGNIVSEALKGSIISHIVNNASTDNHTAILTINDNNGNKLSELTVEKDEFNFVRYSDYGNSESVYVCQSGNTKYKYGLFYSSDEFGLTTLRTDAKIKIHSFNNNIEMTSFGSIDLVGYPINNSDVTKCLMLHNSYNNAAIADKVSSLHLSPGTSGGDGVFMLSSGCGTIFSAENLVNPLDGSTTRKGIKTYNPVEIGYFLPDDDSGVDVDPLYVRGNAHFVAKYNNNNYVGGGNVYAGKDVFATNGWVHTLALEVSDNNYDSRYVINKKWIDNIYQAQTDLETTVETAKQTMQGIVNDAVSDVQDIADTLDLSKYVKIADLNGYVNPLITNNAKNAQSGINNLSIYDALRQLWQKAMNNQ